MNMNFSTTCLTVVVAGLTLVTFGCSTTEQEVEDLIEQLAANEIDSPTWSGAVDELSAIGRPAARQLIAHVPAGYYVGENFREHRREIEKIRVGCDRALAAIKPRAASGAIVGTVSAAFSNSERLAGIQALGEIGFEQATADALEKIVETADSAPTFQTSLAKEEVADPTIRLRAIVALVKMGEDEHAEEIVDAILGDDPVQAEAALSDLATAGHYGVPLLIRLVGEPSPHQERLREIVNRVKDRLIVGLGGEDPEIRALSARALGKIGDNDVRAILIQQLGDPSNRVRFNVATSLAEMEAEEGINFLFSALENSDSIFRANAINFLTDVQVGSAAVEARLIASLQNENRLARSGAAQVLGQARTASATEALLEATRDVDAEVRWNAAIALGAIGATASRQRLQELIDDDDETVAYYAVWALSQLDRG